MYPCHMKTMIRKLLVTATVLWAGALFAPSAYAGCFTTDYAAFALSARVLEPVSLSRTVANDIELGDDSNTERDRTIVGFWHVTFTSEGTTNPPIPDGTVVDNGFAQWHSDKTEIMNSSRPPATGSFCLGVFEKTGRAAYTLNHFALSWNPDGTMQGPASIRETVTLARDGDSYSGTFSIDQYDTNRQLLAHIVGRVTATRITVNTLISDLF